MKVWICKTFYVEGNPDEFQIAQIFDSEQKANDWKVKNPGCYTEIAEMEVE